MSRLGSPRARLRALVALIPVLLLACDRVTPREQPARPAAAAITPSTPATPPSSDAAQAAAPATAPVGPAAAPASPPAPVTVVDATPPAIPPGLTATLANPTTAQLRWGASTDDVGVKGYEVLRDGAVIATEIVTDATARGLAPARRTCFEVRAFDAAGNRSAATPPSCLVAPDVTPPSAPAALEARPESGRVALRWGPAKDDVGVKGYEVLRDGAVVARSAIAQADDAALKPGVRGCYTVVATDAAGNRSPESPPSCTVLADTTPPTVPAAAFARPDGESAVILAWKPSTDDVGVVRYEILKDGNLVATATEPHAAMRNLPTAVEACHAVRACDAASNCSAPSAPACATPPDLTPPTVARVHAATPDSDTQITVRWKPSTDRVGVTSYALRRDSELVAVFPGSATSGADMGLRPASRHCYTVIAEDAAGNASRPGEPVCATTPDLKPPTVPQAVVTAPRSGTQIVVAWSPSTDDVGVEGYEVVRDGKVVAEVDRTQASVTLLAPETDYCHAVRAFDAAGNRSKASAPACTRTARATSPTAPIDVRARVVTKRELLLSWAASPDAGVVYVVYWDGSAHGERSIGTTPERSFKVFGKAAGERHCYRVAALDEERGESPRTFAICASAAGDVPATSTASAALLNSADAP